MASATAPSETALPRSNLIGGLDPQGRPFLLRDRVVMVASFLSNFGIDHSFHNLQCMMWWEEVLACSLDGAVEPSDFVRDGETGVVHSAALQRLLEAWVSDGILVATSGEPEASKAMDFELWPVDAPPNSRAAKDAMNHITQSPWAWMMRDFVYTLTDKFSRGPDGTFDWRHAGNDDFEGIERAKTDADFRSMVRHGPCQREVSSPETARAMFTKMGELSTSPLEQKPWLYGIFYARLLLRAAVLADPDFGSGPYWRMNRRLRIATESADGVVQSVFTLDGGVVAQSSHRQTGPQSIDILHIGFEAGIEPITAVAILRHLGSLQTFATVLLPPPPADWLDLWRRHACRNPEGQWQMTRVSWPAIRQEDGVSAARHPVAC